MTQVNKEKLSRAIAQLMPSIIQGVHMGFLAKRPITHTQFFVMIAIHSRGECSMNVLASSLHVSMPTMTGIIDRLVKAGYVGRWHDKEDRRQTNVSLKAKGRDFIADFQIEVSQRWQQVLSFLEPEEIGQFYAIITKLQKNLQVKT